METNSTLKEHPFEPIYNKNSKILILGSFPSTKSREIGFYYGHPKNRFWKIISNILETKEPTTIEEKKKILIENNIALWDVLKSCTIEGSSDQSIKNPIVNDIEKIIKQSNVKTIFTIGKKANQLYQKYSYEKTKIIAIYLPSTSPANCTIKETELVKEYQIIKKYL